MSSASEITKHTTTPTASATPPRDVTPPLLTPDDFHAQKIVNWHQKLLESDLYLGKAGMFKNVEWVKLSNHHLLVPKKNVALANKQHNECIANDKTENETPTSFEPAAVSAVIKISTDDFWMMADRMWKGPTDFCKTFADIKLTCIGQCPAKEDQFEKDYPTVIDNIKKIMNKVDPSANKTKRGVLVQNNQTATASTVDVKFKHEPFKVNLL